MKTFSKKPVGSILIFVLLSIAAICAAITICAKSSIYSRNFYKKAAMTFPFFDEKGKLRGLLETEAESMANLAFIALQKIKPAGNQSVSDTDIGSANTSQGQSSLWESNNISTEAKIYTLSDLHKELGIKNLSEVKHNENLDAEVGVLPIDNKIPLLKQEGSIYKIHPAFEKEIKLVLAMLLEKNSRPGAPLFPMPGKSAKDTNGKVVDLFMKSIQNYLEKEGGTQRPIISISFLKEVPSIAKNIKNPEIKKFYDDMKKPLKNFLNNVKEHFTICPIDSINFFLANENIQKAIFQNVKEGIEKDKKIKINQTDFARDSNGCIDLKSPDPTDGIDLEIKANYAILNAIAGQNKYSKYRVQKVGENFKSDSGCAAVRVHVYDKDYKSLMKFTRCYFYRVPNKP